MRTLAMLLLLATIIQSCSPSSTVEHEMENAIDHDHAHFDDIEMDFDSALAAKLGADDYGMHPYVMAFLKRGPNRERSKQEADSLQAAHMANIGRMAEEGLLVLAGPFLHDGELRGIYIFDVATVEEAEALTATDPAIQAGSLVMELVPWYGSAALMQVNEVHERISKVRF